jgi:ketosteroid isomerase-like protein
MTDAQAAPDQERAYADACAAEFLTAQQNKALVARFFSEAFDRNNPAVVDELIDPAYAFNGHATTPDQTRNWVVGLHARFNDMHFEVLDLLAEGDKVAIRWRMTGTTPVGQRVTDTGTNVITVRDGRAVSNWQTGGNSPSLVR